ncbi:MAG: D-alanine--D-alanine ligase [Synergistaceae bacterium]|nr:D-alanine--D-alanine ligase [Synergistaceae bacterium]
MRIVVAYGGTSPEREVSLNSGRAVAEALSAMGHSVLLEDVVSPKDFVGKWPDFDAEGVFIALHGDWGEDGRFQTCLDAYCIPYTGSGPEACMFAMDKTVGRLLFSVNGLPIPEGSTIKKGELPGLREKEMLGKYGSLIVKPNSGGSTVGVTLAKTEKELREGIDSCWKAYTHEDKALVEQYIPGREITVPVWEKEDGEVIALPAIDIRPHIGFYDYKNKYTSGCTEYICPAGLSEEASRKIGNLAVLAHKSLGCRSYSRVDFRGTEEDLYILEVNTAPGMTSTSLVPKSAKAYGLQFGEFLESVIKVSFNIKRRF